MSLDDQPTDRRAASRISVGRILRDAIAGLKARFVDVIALGAILLLPPVELAGFVGANPDTGMLWVVLTNLPLLVFEGAAIRLIYGALAGKPAAPAGEALRLGVSRLSQLFSIFALTFSPILLVAAVLSLLGQTVMLAAAPVVLAGALALNLLLFVAPPLVMIEDMPAFPAMSLSARLSKGNRWPMLLVVFLSALLTGLSVAVPYGAQALIAMVAPKTLAERISTFVAEPLVTLLVEPLGAALVTAAYLELRRATGFAPARPARQNHD